MSQYRSSSKPYSQISKNLGIFHVFKMLIVTEQSKPTYTKLEKKERKKNLEVFGDIRGPEFSEWYLFHLTSPNGSNRT